MLGPPLATSAADRWSTGDGDGDVAEYAPAGQQKGRQGQDGPAHVLYVWRCVPRRSDSDPSAGPAGGLHGPFVLSAFLFFFSPPGAAPARHASPEGPVMSSASAASTGSGSGSSWRIVFEPTLDICI
jgi:hypothetical protein